jgi:hypothetical protein
MLKDVIPDQHGGFTVCGAEVTAAGRSTPASEIIVATFDHDATLTGMTRMSGRTCALLPGRSGNVRLLRDEEGADRYSLLLTTLSATLETLSEETLMTNFAGGVTFAAFENADGTIVFASPWYGWESVEIRSGSSRESFHLDLDPGTFVDILPGPSRIYVVSQMFKPTVPPPQESRYGLRVQALDLIPLAGRAR